VRLPYSGLKGLSKLLLKLVPGLNFISTAYDVYEAVKQVVDVIVNFDSMVQYINATTYCTRGGIQGRRLLQANSSNTTNITVLAPVNDSMVNFVAGNGTANITVPDYSAILCDDGGAIPTTLRCACDNETAVNTCGEIDLVPAANWLVPPGTGWTNSICQPEVCGGVPTNPLGGVTVTYILSTSVNFNSFSNDKATTFLDGILNGTGVDNGTFIVSITTNPLLPGIVAIQVYSPSVVDNGTLVTFTGVPPLTVTSVSSVAGFNNVPPNVPGYTQAPTTSAPSTAPTAMPSMAPSGAPNTSPTTKAPGTQGTPTKTPSGKVLNSGFQAMPPFLLCLTLVMVFTLI